MTRINVIPPAELCDKHLLAEYRELPRVFRLARACPDAPKEYTLGRGHVMFFYDKLAYLTKRFDQLVGEMITRGWHPKFLEVPAWVYDLPYELWGDYIPTSADITINRARISERLRNRGANP